MESEDGENVEYPDEIFEDAPKDAMDCEEDDDDGAATGRTLNYGNVPGEQLGLHPQTLQELLKGRNRDAAQHEIEKRVFLIASIYHFAGVRLRNSSGGPSLALFDTETRAFVQQYPRINVVLPSGRQPSFLMSEADALACGDEAAS